METVQYSSITCYTCGYPNHTSATCSLANRGGRRGGITFPFNRKPKKNKKKEPQVPQKSTFSTDYVTDDTCDFDTSSLESVSDLCAVIPLEGEFFSYVNILFDNKVRRKALIDTGSCANAIPGNLVEQLKNSNAKFEFTTPSFKNVQMASGMPINISKAVKITFDITNHEFTDIFLVLPTMNSVIIGNPFFKKNMIWICPAFNLLKLPNLTVQLNEIKPKGKSIYYLKKLKKIPIFLIEKHALPPNSHQTLECSLKENSENFSECSGVDIPNDEFEQSTEVALTSSLSTAEKDEKIFISAINITDHYVHLKANTLVASFEVLSQAQAEKFINIDLQLIALAKQRDPDDIKNGLNQLIQMESSNEE